MRSSGNPARLWPPSKRHFLYPLGSGLPVSVISFMEYPGLFPGMCKIDAKTNKTRRFEYFTCNPMREPPFQKKCKNGISWITVRINLFIIRVWKRVATTSSSALQKDLLQYLAIGASFCAYGHRSKKVEGACSGVQRPRDITGKTFFLVQGTLGPIATSAIRSQIV